MVGIGDYTGPAPGGRTHDGAAVGVALASGPPSPGAAAPAAAGTDPHRLAPESPRGVATAAAALPPQVRDVRPGDPMARLAHHALPAALDPFTALDSVFRGLA
jgi:hypothetical protein